MQSAGAFFGQVRNAWPMTTRRAAPLSDTFDEFLAAAAAKRVRDAGAIPLGKLLPKGLSRTGQAAFAEALARTGLERTGTRIREPVQEQLVAKLNVEDALPLAALHKRLKGASSVEVTRAIVRLTAAGVAVVVVRNGKEQLTARCEAGLSQEELAVLRACGKALDAMLRWTKPKKGAAARTLHRGDLASFISKLPGQRPTKSDPAEIDARVLGAVRSVADARTGLASVPDAVKTLLESVTTADVCDALLRLHATGRLELRPESGVGLLTEPEAALCPRGARGTVLSCARLLPDVPSASRP